MKPVLVVFRDVGIAGGVSRVFADNYSRVFDIVCDGATIKVHVRTGAGSMVPEGVEALNGEFIFDLVAKTTNATPEQTNEILRWVDIRPMPELAATLNVNK